MNTLFLTVIFLTNVISTLAMQQLAQPAIGWIGGGTVVVHETDPSSIVMDGTNRYIKIKALLDAGYGSDTTKTEEIKKLHVALECISFHNRLYPEEKDENIQILKLLLAHPNINLNDTNYGRLGRTALLTACMHQRNAKIVTILLEHGATKWNALSKLNESPVSATITPLQAAEHNGITVLKDWIAQVHIPLFTAASAGDLQAVSNLLSNRSPALLIGQDAQGNTMLHTGITNIQLTRLLLSLCPKAARIKNDKGEMPLSVAIKKGKSTAMLMLLCKDNSVITPEDVLQTIASNKNRLLQGLLKAGAL